MTTTDSLFWIGMLGFLLIFGGISYCNAVAGECKKISRADLGKIMAPGILLFTTGFIGVVFVMIRLMIGAWK